MPNWKKLIVSGSDALLNSLTVSTTGRFDDDLTISGSNSSLILKGDGSKFARLTHNASGLVIDGGVQNQYISIGSPTWSWPNGVRVYGDLQLTGSAGGTATFEGSTQSTVNLKTTTNSKNNYLVGTTTGDISFRPDGTESVFLKSDGKVGIGFNSLVNQLDVNGVIMGTGIRFGSQASGEGIMRVNGTGNGNGLAFTTGNFSSNYVALYVDHSSNNGKVGIGTTAPTKQLQVIGDISGSDIFIDDWNSVSSSLSTLTQNQTLNTGGTVNYVARFESADTITTGIIRDDGSTVGINAAPSANKTLYIDGTIQATGEAFFSHLDIIGSGGNSRIRDDVQLKFGSNRIFGIQYNSSGDYLEFTSGSNNLVTLLGNGNVGIGTTSPANKLHLVLGTTADKFSIERGGSVKAYIDGNGAIVSYANLVSYGNSLAGGGGIFRYGGGMGTQTIGHQFKHVTGAFTGTSGDQTMLEIIPTINQSSTAGYTGLKVNVTETATGSGDKNLLDLQVGGTSKYKVTSDGDLTMSGDLVVAGTVTAQEFHTEFVSASIIYESGSTKFGDTSEDIHSFSGSLRVTGSGNHYFTHGNVGIGTTSPGEKLTVKDGAIITTDSSGVNYAKLDRFGGLTMKGNGAGARGIQTPNTDALTFGTNGTERMRISSAGALKFNSYGSGNNTGTLAYTLGLDSSGNVIEFTGGSGGSVSSITSGADTRVAYFNGSDSLEGSANFTWDDSQLTIVGDVEAEEFIGDLRGAVLFKAQAGEALSKGDVVYISGISGNTTIVSKADADDANKMPAFGIAAAAASSNNPIDIYTSGILSGLNTSGFSIGDELFVSSSAGELTSTRPTGESSLLQKIAKVTRVDNAAGSIFITGAGRTNAVPNLNTGRLFVGNASNQAVADGTIHVDIANSKVGIGTDNPIYKLQIAGSTYVNNGTLFLDSNRSLMWGNSNQGIKAVNDSNLIFRTGGSEQMFLTAGGNVGIGTSNVSRINSTSTFFQPDEDGRFLVMNHNSGSFIMLETNANGGGDQVGGIFFNKVGNQSDAHIHVAGIDAVLVDHATDALDGGELRFFTKVAGAGDTSHHMLLDADGNLGIGQNIDPAQRLHVDGNIRVGDSSDAIYSNRFFGLSNAAVYVQSNSGYPIIFNAGASEKMRITNGGNVGIGTTSPASKLEVQTGYIISSGSGAADLGFVLDRAGLDTYHIRHLDGGLTIYNNTDNRKEMTFDGTGKVGIGTSTPARTLDVNGEIQNNGIFRKGGNVIIKSTGSETMFGPGGSGIITFHNSATMTTGDETIRIDADGNLLLNNTSAGARLDIREDTNYAIQAEDASGHYFRVNTGGDVDMRGDLVVQGTITAQEFHTEFVSASIIYDSGSTKFGDTADDNHDFTGSVQITNAGTNTQLFRASRASTYAFELGNYAEGNHFVNGSVVAHTIRNTNSSVNAAVLRLGHSGTGAHITSYSTNEDLIISPNGTGNVGIGTTTPSQKLEVNGAVLAGDYRGSTHIYLTSPDSWIFRSTGGTERMKIDSAGSLLLGNTTAYQKVIFDPTPSTVLGNGTLTITPSTAPGSGTAQFYTRFLDRTGGGTTKHNVIVDGKVGIGTTSPGTELQISTTMTSSPTSNIFLDVEGSNTTGGGGSIIFGTSASAGTPSTYNAKITGTRVSGGTGGDSQLGFWTTLVSDSTNPQERMTITKEGNVGIGTSTPGEKLDVNGSVQANNFKVAEKIIHKGDAHTFIHFTSDTITFDTGGSTVLTLDSSQNVNATGTISGSDVYINDWGSVSASLASIQQAGGVNGTGASNKVAIWSDTDTLTSDTNLHWDSSNDRLGVSNISPSYTLDVGGTSRIAGTIHMYGAVRNYSGDFSLQNGVQDADILFKVNDGGTTTTAMMVDGATSNVGIGATSPAFKTTIYSDSTTDSFPLVVGQPNAANEFVGIGLSGFVASNGAVKAGLVLDRKNTYGVGDIHILNNTTTDNSNATLADSKLTILQNGNVGIGTVNPGASLHVASTTNDYVAKFSHTTATGYAPGSILLQAGQHASRGQGLFHYNTEADDSWFTGVPYNVDSTKWIVAHKADTTFNPDVAQLSHAIFTIDSATDNVGIGESSPLTRLHVKIGGTDGTKSVYGRVLIEDTDAQLDLLSTSSGTWGSAINFIEAAGSSANTDIWSIARQTTGGTGDSSLRINFGTNNQHDNTNKFKLDTAGNITIPGGITVGDSNADTAQIGQKHLLGYCENTDVDTGTETVKELALSVYQAVFFDYVVKNGTNLRAGTVTAVHDGTNVEYTDTSTKDLGDTSAVTLSVDISGTNMRLRATTTSDNWIVKANIRGIKV